MKIIDYHCTLGVPYQPHDIPEPSSIVVPYTRASEHSNPLEHHRVYSSIPIAECLTGTKWDALALAYVSAFQPYSIRVTQGELKSNATVGRVTVIVDENDIIKEITQECLFRISNTITVEHGHAFTQAIDAKVKAKYGAD